MTPAEKRVQELLDRWMTSLEHHVRYLKLDDAAYARAENWPRHQRPTSWVIELARKRLGELRGLLADRIGRGDDGFADALELMSFLTTLLGSEHIERFVPLASGKPPDASASGTVEQPRPRAAKSASRPTTSASGRHAIGATGKQPVATGKQPVASGAARSASPSSTAARATPSSRTSASGIRRAITPSAVPGRSASRPASPGAAPAAAAPPKDAIARQVVADAVRMLEWGREWPALAGLIARMADRPSEPDVWKILRAYRSEILAKAHRPAD